jgi:hypothetical protein
MLIIHSANVVSNVAAIFRSCGTNSANFIGDIHSRDGCCQQGVDFIGVSEALLEFVNNMLRRLRRNGSGVE